MGNLGILLLFIFACLIASSVQYSSYLEHQAIHSFAAYCPPEKIQNWTCYWCRHPDARQITVVKTIYNSKEDSFAYVGYHHNIIQIAIRGTIALSLTDWIADLEFNKVTFNGIKGVEVHEGFYEVYKSLQAGIISGFNLATSQCSGCNEVHVTGHSLGGAVATIAALEIQNMTSMDVKLANYGSPRVGNKAFSQLVRDSMSSTARVVHGEDLVPHVPLETQGFYHIPTEYWQNKGELKQCDDSGEDPTCSDTVWIGNLEDHVFYINYHLWSGLPDCGGIFDEIPPQKQPLV